MTREKIIEKIEAFAQTCEPHKQNRAFFALGYQRALYKKEKAIKDQLSPLQVFMVVVSYYKLKGKEVITASRKTELVRARKMYCYIAKEMCRKKTLSSIGDMFSYDHSTVLHHWHDIEGLITGNYVDVEYKREVSEINKIILGYEGN